MSTRADNAPSNGALVKRLDQGGWPSIAEEVRDGVSREVIEGRIRHVVPWDEQDELFALLGE